MRRVTSLHSTGVGIDREVDSKYDTIKIIADNIETLIKYLGAYEAAPTTRPDSTPLENGDYYFNTTLGIEGNYYYDLVQTTWFAGAVDGEGGGGGSVFSVNGEVGTVVLDATDIGLSNVENTADLAKVVSTATTAELNKKVDSTSVGTINGVASLGADGKVPSGQLPTASVGVGLGETAITAYRGDRGKIAYDHSQTAVTKSTITDFSDSDYATGAEGDLAVSALQPNDNISELANDSAFITLTDIPASSSSLNELTDVDTAGGMEGSILVRRSGVYVPEAKPASGSNPAATDVTFSNTASGLSAINAQTAIDEVEARVTANDAKETNVDYDDTALVTAVGLNTLKNTNVEHPLVEKAVPSNALFTDTDTTYSDLTEFSNTTTQFITIDDVPANTGEANTASSQGAGNSIVLSKSGSDLPFKSIVAGAGVSIDVAADTLTLNSTASGGGEVNTSSSLGGGEPVAATKSGADLPFKSLVAGTAVTLTSDANTITINSTATSGASVWGDLGGILTNQTDLDTALQSKEPSITVKNTGFNRPIGTGANELAEGSHTHNAADIGTTTEWDDAYTHSGSLHAPTDADSTSANETSHVAVDAHMALVNEHIDWSLTNAKNVHTDNYDNTDTVYTLDKTKVEAVLIGEIASHTHAATTETDPVFTASQASSINAGDITNLSNLSGINTGDQAIPVVTVDFDAAGTDNSNNNAANSLYSGLVSNVSTNLTNSTSATTITVESSDGGDTVLPSATQTNAGVMSAADKTTLDGLSASLDIPTSVVTELPGSPTVGTLYIVVPS